MISFNLKANFLFKKLLFHTDFHFKISGGGGVIKVLVLSCSKNKNKLNPTTVSVSDYLSLLNIMSNHLNF